MSSIYILSDNGKLTKKDETIVFSQPDGTYSVIFPFKTELLMLIGKVSISADALCVIMKYKIPVIFLSKNGKFNGKIEFGENKNVFLRQKPYSILSDEKNHLKLQGLLLQEK